LAASVLAFLAVATFSPRDRLGPGFHNAVGPVGHAIAESLRGLFGVCAIVIPVIGAYTTGILFVGDREKRRWPQALAASLLLISTSVLAQLVFKEDSTWAHAPGGLIGRELGGALGALFSTVGTVILVSAVAVTAFIVGTEFAFLHFCAWAWDRSRVMAARCRVWAIAFAAHLRERLQAHAEARAVARAKAKEDEETFLADLEAEEAELLELEQAAAEAEALADAAAREQRCKDESVLERERLRVERERLGLEREAARLAKDALKQARALEKDTRGDASASLAPALVGEARAPLAAVPGGDPAWASALASSVAPTQVSVPPQKRVPTIVAPPPPPRDAFASMPPGPLATVGQEPAEGLDTEPAAGAAALGPQRSGVSLSGGVGATALARMPVIIEPKAPPRPTAKRPQFEFAEGRTGFELPPVDVLEAHSREHSALDKDAFLDTAARLTAKLRDFGIEGEVVEIRPGPVVTMYEFKPAPGVKISKIASLADDLAMAMEAMRVRIVAPIPGKGVVGVEVPNKVRESVFLKEVAEQDTFQKSASRLAMCLGKDIEGMPYILDLAKAPHLLMAGTTGSGKSVSVNSMIMSILLKATPDEVRFIMVDPKMLELSVYEGIPHLLLPVVTDPRKAAVALQWAVEEMTRRYKLLSEAGVRNIAGYNDLVAKEQQQKGPLSLEALSPYSPTEVAGGAGPAPSAKKRRRLTIVDVSPDGTPIDSADLTAATAPGAHAGPESGLGVASPSSAESQAATTLSPEVAAEVQAAALATEIRVDESQLDSTTEQEAAALAQAAATAAAVSEAPAERAKMPYIVVIIDELADLMMVASKEVETSIARLAQMARAAGIHLMVATQRPSTDVVTGLIKANFPTRISFMLRTKIDSMTILGATGAEALLGMGDMLILPPTSAHLQRVHGCFVSEVEIKRVVDHLKAQGKPVYDESILRPREEEDGTVEDGGDELSDELYDQAVAVVSEMKTVSISMLQRKMRIGYNRAARMIERMERDGMVGAADGAKPREVLLRPLGMMPGAGAF
jgi:S-DNA-T family DNA segregation ATPase FtsK/SpoIIIE